MRHLYMVIDTTTTKTTKILYIAELQASQYWGRILTHRGLKVIAPALEAKGFTKLDHLDLQYLYWNTFGETPPDIYAELVQHCFARAKLLEIDKTDIRELEYQVKKIEEQQAAGLPAAPAAAAGEPQNSHRPRTAGATAKVWEIADQMAAAAGGAIPDRKALIDECVRQGINASTASTQFSKWKSGYVRPN